MYLDSQLKKGNYNKDKRERLFATLCSPIIINIVKTSH